MAPKHTPDSAAPDARNREAAELLLEELEGNGLEVCKVPGLEGGYVRVSVSVNCEWYRRLCCQWKKSRRRYPKARTIIKRVHTVAALRRIIAGNFSGVYAQRLQPFIEEGEREIKEVA